MIIVVMGVCGSGKTTVGSLLAEKMGCSFADADQFHCEANKAKMSRGQPLTDEDRIPWLSSIHEYMLSKHKEGQSVVVTCSALKRSYRTILTCGNPRNTGRRTDTSSSMHSNLTSTLDSDDHFGQHSSHTVEHISDSPSAGTPQENRLTCTGNSQQSEQIGPNIKERAGISKTATDKETNLVVNGAMEGASNVDDSGAKMNVVYVHLTGSMAVLQERLCNRKGHFMPSSMLQSQLDTLELLTSDEMGFSVNIDKSTDDLVSEVLIKLGVIS